MQKVKVYVSITGDYCAFHEMGFYVDYDITNDLPLGDYTLEELELGCDSDWKDFEVRDAVLIDGTYYVNW